MKPPRSCPHSDLLMGNRHPIPRTSPDHTWHPRRGVQRTESECSGTGWCWDPLRAGIRDSPLPGALCDPEHFNYGVAAHHAYKDGRLSCDIVAEQQKVREADLLLFQVGAAGATAGPGTPPRHNSGARKAIMSGWLGHVSLSHWVPHIQIGLPRKNFWAQALPHPRTSAAQCPVPCAQCLLPTGTCFQAATVGAAPSLAPGPHCTPRKGKRERSLRATHRHWGSEPSPRPTKNRQAESL